MQANRHLLQSAEPWQQSRHSHKVSLSQKIKIMRFLMTTTWIQNQTTDSSSAWKCEPDTPQTLPLTTSFTFVGRKTWNFHLHQFLWSCIWKGAHFYAEFRAIYGISIGQKLSELWPFYWFLTHPLLSFFGDY
jgi:hypothetical protein